MAVKKKKKKVVSKYKGFSGITSKTVKSTVTKKKPKVNKDAKNSGAKSLAKQSKDLKTGLGYLTGSKKTKVGSAGKGPKPVNTLGKKYGSKVTKNKFASGTGVGAKSQNTGLNKKKTKKKLSIGPAGNYDSMRLLYGNVKRKPKKKK